MPRYLYLLRHGQSAEKQIGQLDKDRELTTAGIKQSMRIAAYLRQEKTFLDLVISSSSARTRETTTLISDALRIDSEIIVFDDELYEASTRTLLQTVAQLEDNHHHVLFVGHNPAISYLAEYLTKAEIGDMVPAGMAIIQFDSPSWAEASQGVGQLVQYVEPEKITF